jgi:hypothetical protein
LETLDETSGGVLFAGHSPIRFPQPSLWDGQTNNLLRHRSMLTKTITMPHYPSATAT